MCKLNAIITIIALKWLLELHFEMETKYLLDHCEDFAVAIISDISQCNERGFRQ